MAALVSRPVCQRQRTDLKVLAHIREHFALSNGSYGRPRMTMEVREAGPDAGARRVGRVMGDNGIRPERIRRQTCKTHLSFCIAGSPGQSLPTGLRFDFTVERRTTVMHQMLHCCPFALRCRQS